MINPLKMRHISNIWELHEKNQNFMHNEIDSIQNSGNAVAISSSIAGV